MPDLVRQTLMSIVNLVSEHWVVLDKYMEGVAALAAGPLGFVVLQMLGPLGPILQDPLRGSSLSSLPRF